MSADASLALQDMIVARVNSANAVPAGNVFYSGAKLTAFPCVVIGEADALYPDYVSDFAIRVALDLHVWSEETGFTDCKSIAGALRNAILPRPWTVADHTCIHVQIERTRYMRDPDGKHAHAVVSVLAILQESRKL